MVVMGRIAAPYGVLGWIKVRPDTEFLDGLLDYPQWWVQGRETAWRAVAVEEAKVHGDHLVARLHGVNDRDQALQLKGLLIAVPRAQLPAPGSDEYYWSDLIGLAVRNVQGIEMGHVHELFETGANDVMVVRGERERLLPFTGSVVLEVDLPAKRMLVDWDADFE